MSDREYSDMLRARSEADVIRSSNSDDPLAEGEGESVDDWILRVYNDRQLAMAARAMRLRLDEGDWVRVEVPYPHAQVFLYRDWWIDPRNLLEPASSLAELDQSDGGMYRLEGGTLHLKLQVWSGRDYAVIDVCRFENCP